MMLGTLNKKIAFTFLLSVLLYFSAVNFPFRGYMIREAEQSTESRMKNAGYYFADEYIERAERGQEITKEEYDDLTEALAYFTGFRVWIVSADGTIISDTDGSANDGVSLTEIRSDYLEQTVLYGENLDGLLTGKNISLVCPINYRFALKGYIVIHCSYSVIEDSYEGYIFWANTLGLAVAVVMLFVAACYGVYYTRVVNKLIETTVSYTNGKFDERITMKLPDEHQKLANAIVCLAEKNEGLIEYQKNFIANVSHDFRSPLTSIKGYTEAMKEGIIPYEAQGKYLDIILFETERLTGLTQNLLQLNEFDNKGIKLELSDFNVCSMVKQSAATFEAKCAEKKLKIRLVFAEREIWVRADKSKIQQVLHNLIDNATKFSNDDGMIIITISETDNRVWVSVKDQGIGIPRESLNQVWERFYKTDLSRGKDKKGTGLGLSITRQIINAHGETIMVNSKVGEGTEFKFTLKRIEKA